MNICDLLARAAVAACLPHRRIGGASFCTRPAFCRQPFFRTSGGDDHLRFDPRSLRRYRLAIPRGLEPLGVNELLRDLKERNIRTKTRLLSTGATRGGIPFGRGALYYVLSNHFYIGERKDFVAFFRMRRPALF
jgi:hypothetical protein